MRGFFIALVAALFCWNARAGLVVHTAEIGVGKFHRYDNHLHPYGESHAWTSYILNENARGSLITQRNSDGSYTIFFSTLEQMFEAVAQLAHNENQKISVLNVHGHGLPGAMWFPRDGAALASPDCMSWRVAANGADRDNYEQYYSALTASEVLRLRALANDTVAHLACTSDLRDWQSLSVKHPQFKAAFAPEAQIHFASCIVGLGIRGDSFTNGIANLLLPPGSGRVETSVNYGLGDYSMRSGMGFWDYRTDEQLARDNLVYQRDHSDSEIAQKGTLRVAQFIDNHWRTSVYWNQNFMSLAFGPLVGSPALPELDEVWATETLPLPTSIRVPGTKVSVPVSYYEPTESDSGHQQ